VEFLPSHPPLNSPTDEDLSLDARIRGMDEDPGRADAGRNPEGPPVPRFPDGFQIRVKIVIGSMLNAGTVSKLVLDSFCRPVLVRGPHVFQCVNNDKGKEDDD
jgi:hypothetical protein